jgi:hypothetical protein
MSRTECFRTSVSLPQYQKLLVKCTVVAIIVMNKIDDCGTSVEVVLISEVRSEN